MFDLKTLEYSNGQLTIIDQTLLPEQTVYRTITNVADLREAIIRLRVRGAPAIGISAAYGLVIAALTGPQDDYPSFLASFNQAAAELASARPTAVNLIWAIRKMQAVALAGESVPTASLICRLEAEARAIEAEDRATNRAIGENLLSLLHDGDTVLTHCNAGILATSHYGTALSPFYLAQERGMKLHVYADETRPLLQGARLTAYELQVSGVDVTLICDNMAATVMAQGRIQAVIVGCDRVAANGDTANKIGTLGVSILAKYYGIPFYIAAPTSTIDWQCRTGREIPIEERDRQEVIYRDGIWTAPRDIKVYNPAFDVTPAANITAIVTEKGIVRAPDAEYLACLACRR